MPTAPSDGAQLTQLLGSRPIFVSPGIARRAGSRSPPKCVDFADLLANRRARRRRDELAKYCSHDRVRVDPRLWSAVGEDRLARRFMPVTAALSDELRRARTWKGCRMIGLSLVLNETANLALSLADAGAEVPWSATPRAPRRRCGRAAPPVSRCSRAPTPTGPPNTNWRWCSWTGDTTSSSTTVSVIRLAHAERPEILEATIGASRRPPAAAPLAGRWNATADSHTRHRRQRRPLQDAVRQRIRTGQSTGVHHRDLLRHG